MPSRRLFDGASIEIGTIPIEQIAAITGSLSKTLDNATLQAVADLTGGVAITGDLSKTLADISLVAFGQVGEVTPQKIYQQIWIIDERKKGEPRKSRRVVRKLKRQVKQAVEAVEAVKDSQRQQKTLLQQQQALALAEEQIRLTLELLTLEERKLELGKIAEAAQAKIRFEEYIRQQYETAVRLYQEEQLKKEKERQRREQEEQEDLQMLLNYLMAEA